MLPAFLAGLALNRTVAALLGAEPTADPTSAAAESIRVFVLAGQPNMEGQSVADLDDSPNPGHGHHEFGNAETGLRVGVGLGRAMVELLERGQTPGRSEAAKATGHVPRRSEAGRCG